MSLPDPKEVADRLAVVGELLFKDPPALEIFGVVLRAYAESEEVCGQRRRFGDRCLWSRSEHEGDERITHPFVPARLIEENTE